MVKQVSLGLRAEGTAIFESNPAWSGGKGQTRCTEYEKVRGTRYRPVHDDVGPWVSWTGMTGYPEWTTPRPRVPKQKPKTGGIVVGEGQQCPCTQLEGLGAVWLCKAKVNNRRKCATAIVGHHVGRQGALGDRYLLT